MSKYIPGSEKFEINMEYKNSIQPKHSWLDEKTHESNQQSAIVRCGALLHGKTQAWVTANTAIPYPLSQEYVNQYLVDLTLSKGKKFPWGNGYIQDESAIFLGLMLTEKKADMSKKDFNRWVKSHGLMAHIDINQHIFLYKNRALDQEWRDILSAVSDKIARCKCACKKIKPQFADTPQHKLFFAVVERAINDLSLNPFKNIVSDGVTTKILPNKSTFYTMHTSAEYLQGDIIHADSAGVDPDWIRRILREFKLLK